jgi:hypothetical protein
MKGIESVKKWIGQHKLATITIVVVAWILLIVSLVFIIGDGQQKSAIEIDAEEQAAWNEEFYNDPILNYLPYEELAFDITPIYDDDGFSSLAVNIRLSAADARGGQAAGAELYKNRVLEVIRSFGLSPSDYDIEWNIESTSLY